MQKYLVSGEKPSLSNQEIDAIDDIVTKVKSQKEATIKRLRKSFKYNDETINELFEEISKENVQVN